MVSTRARLDTCQPRQGMPVPTLIRSGGAPLAGRTPLVMWTQPTTRPRLSRKSTFVSPPPTLVLQLSLGFRSWPEPQSGHPVTVTAACVLFVKTTGYGVSDVLVPDACGAPLPDPQLVMAKRASATPQSHADRRITVSRRSGTSEGSHESRDARYTELIRSGG